MRFRYLTEKNGKLIKKAAVYIQSEHKINPANVDPQAVYIVERLQTEGYETYIVGGAVRDLILGKKPKDFDIATSASPGRIKKAFRNARIIGRRFRLVHIFFGAKIIEVSTFRSIKDGSTSNTFGTIEEDVHRRDFTINALLYDPVKQSVVDYLGGMKDLRCGLIRPIIPLTHIFTEDPVRIIRAVKYAAVTGSKIPLMLKMRIKKDSGLLAEISPSRLTEEIFKIINSSDPAGIIKNMDAFGIYKYLQPSAAELFKTMPGFKERYLKTFASLSEGKKHPEAEPPKYGKTLSALIRDYVEDATEWNEEGRETERFKETFNLARKFVLPMNPPKAELYSAMRLLFAGHGIIVKRTRFNERQKSKGKAEEKPPAAKPADSPPVKRRKRKPGRIQKNNPSDLTV